jgi:outer membrane protein TolC
MIRKHFLRILATAGVFLLCTTSALTDEVRHLKLSEAVQLALKHNHNVRIAQYGVDEKQHAKEAAKSSYFPSIRNDSSFLRVTDTQLIQIAPGSLGEAAGTPIPTVNDIINQGGRNLITSGTQITQPLTSLLKIKQANQIAQAEAQASREKADLVENDVALAVHEVYYGILVAQAHRTATEARIKASQDLQNERIEQVKFGSALEQDSIESRAQVLQAKQELLTTDLQLDDLKLKLNDMMGLPLTTGLIPQFSNFKRLARAMNVLRQQWTRILKSVKLVPKWRKRRRQSVCPRPTSGFPMWRLSPATAIRKMSRFWRITLARSEFTSATTCLMEGVSERCCVSIKRSCLKRKRTSLG